jgi:heptosyltransferase III
VQSSQNIKSILLIKFKNIGDVLLMTPAIHTLRIRYPAAKITAMVNDYTADLLNRNPDVDQIITLDRNRCKKGLLFSKLLYELHLIRKIRALKPNLVIDFTSGDRAARYALLSGAPKKIGYHLNRGKFSWKNLVYTEKVERPCGSTHQVIKDLRLVGVTSSEIKDYPLHLWHQDKDLDWARNFWQPNKIKVHIHPVARWLYKCWHDERMAELVDRLIVNGADVVLTCGPEENEIKRAKSIVQKCKSSPRSLFGDISLSQLAAISKTADLFVGVDTAPMHIAAATGTPIIALFGPTGIDWHPWSMSAIILRKPCPDKHLREQIGDESSLIEVTLDEVWRECGKILYPKLKT